MNWQDITIKKYKQIIKISSSDMTDDEKLLTILAIAGDHPEDFYYDKSIVEVHQESEAISFISERIPAVLKYKFELKDHVYILTKDLSKMPASQYMDYNNVMRVTPDDYAMLMAVLYVPDGFEYGKGYDIFELKDIFEDNLPITIVMGASAFFLSLLKHLTKHSLRSSLKKLRKELKREKDPERKVAITNAIASLQEEIVLCGLE